ncbi:unnamed protein product [Gongylonema pulchrum]|uniref:Creatinase_N domain-containing protein n=1 Tax=Gongylonema pulchrum TaxID=637853 RepID=A0A183CYV6_9BILA|nr:unnamed protein product [Gongylonema pulchrum]
MAFAVVRRTTVAAAVACAHGRRLHTLCFSALASCSTVQATMNLTDGIPNRKLESFRALFTRDDIVKLAGGVIDAYLLPSTDAHQSEYISEHDFRVRFLSGFSGSSAFALITPRKALLWTDGRYFIQARAQLEPGWKLMKDAVPGAISTTEWMVQNLKAGSRVAFDPKLYRHAEALRLMATLRSVGITVVPVQGNLVIAMKKEEYGVETSEKIEIIRADLKLNGCSSSIFSALDDIAWLLNIRGSDIPHNPLVYAVVFMTPDDVHLFISGKKLTDDLRKHLSVVHIHEYEEATQWIKDWLGNHRGIKV